MFKLNFIIILLSCSVQLFSQTYSERSLYKDTYSTDEVKTLEVINKYGTIHIKNWDKDSISIETDVSLSSTSLKKLNKLKDAVKIKYNLQNNILVAKTIFDASKTSFMKDVQDITRDITPGTDKRMEINYEIFIPSSLNLKVVNQYGDIFIEDTDKNLTIELSNGSLKANKINNHATIKLRFAKAMINEIKEGYITLSYSKLNINKSINLNCESKSSDVFIENIGVIKIKSSRGSINLSNVDYLYGSSSYTELKIMNLNKEIDAYFTYGEIDINKISNNVSLIDIDSERTDISLYIPKNTNFSYDILYHENTDLRLPIKDTKITNSIEMDGIKSQKGVSGKNPSLEIRIRALKRSLIQIHHFGDS